MLKYSIENLLKQQLTAKELKKANKELAGLLSVSLGHFKYKICKYAYKADQGKEYLLGTLTTDQLWGCLLYTSPSPRDATLSRMPSSA